MARYYIKKYTMALLLFAIPCTIVAADSTQKSNDNNEVKATTVALNQLKQEVSVSNAKIKKLQNQLESSNAKIDSLENKIKELQGDVKTNQAQTSQKIEATHTTIEALRNSLKDKVIVFGIILAIIVLLVSAIVLSLRKKLHSHSVSLEAAQQKVKDLQEGQQNIEEGAASLDDKVTDLLEKHLSLPQQTSQDHSLALKVADEIVRIETNLYRMEPSTRGYKQLTRSVQRMKDCFMTKGYEISDLLGKPYNEGMKVVANFVVDETLPEGEAIITGIIKPQIIYNGKMIQAAQITVSQNI